MTCPMSRDRRWGKRPLKCSLTPRLQHESQVLHERPHVLTHTRPERGPQPVLTGRVTNLVQRLFYSV